MKLTFKRGKPNRGRRFWCWTKGKDGQPRLGRWHPFACGVTTTGKNNDLGLMWSRPHKRWFTREELWDENGRLKPEFTDGASTHAPWGLVMSVRAFRRRLRQWKRYLPKGVEFVLCSRFDEYEVIGRT